MRLSAGTGGMSCYPGTRVRCAGFGDSIRDGPSPGTPRRARHPRGELRARHGLRTPDALHRAVAQLAGCDELWTNDNRLAAAAEGLAVNVVE